MDENIQIYIIILNINSLKIFNYIIIMASSFYYEKTAVTHCLPSHLNNNIKSYFNIVTITIMLKIMYKNGYYSITYTHYTYLTYTHFSSYCTELYARAKLPSNNCCRVAGNKQQRAEASTSQCNYSDALY